MYTQCSKCETVFKLSAETLRAAGGQVRCGKCGEVFNALARLAEDPSAFIVDETEIDLEFRADNILQSPAPMTPGKDEEPETGDFGVETAHLRIDWDVSEEPPQSENKGDESFGGEALGDESLSETSMEFTLPPGELDRIFVGSKKPAVTDPPLVVEKVSHDPPSAPTHPLAPSPPLAPPPSLAPPRSLAPRLRRASPPEPLPPPHPEDIAIRRANAEEADSESEPLSPAAPGAAAPAGLEVSEDVRREMLSGMASGSDRPLKRRAAPDAAAPFDLGTRVRRTPTPWLIAAIASALLLIVQIVQHNREGIAALFSKVGGQAPAASTLAVYQLRQWGVTGDPAADGTLRVRASILNTAAQLQPYPLLRVTLANRFGGSIGTRDFEPSEYLGRPTAKLLAPGERVDATVDILDPGKNAEGFEIDVCLRASDRKVSCANDAAPPQAKR